MGSSLARYHLSRVLLLVLVSVLVASAIKQQLAIKRPAQFSEQDASINQQLGSSNQATARPHQQADTTTPISDKTSSKAQDPTDPLGPKVPCNQIHNVTCFNGGICYIINDKAQCECRPENYGQYCEHTHLCLAEYGNQTGEQICKQLDATCDNEKDLFLRCNCPEGEYFVFQTLPQNSSSPATGTGASSVQPSNKSRFSNQRKNTTTTAAAAATISTPSPEREPENVKYRAECRKIDSCVGVKCARMSQVCENGQCVCDKAAGYSLDLADNECKLINPCEQERPLGSGPICGEADCLPTYNGDLYKCVCPLGYTPVQSGVEPSSIKCTILEEKAICGNPLLNKCEHKCQVEDNSKIKCICYDGYKPGSRPNIDDHLCFFEMDLEHFKNENQTALSAAKETGLNPIGMDVAFNPKKLPSWGCLQGCANDNMICMKSTHRQGGFNCVCDRQSYITVGRDKETCVDWCEASQQNGNLLSSLDEVCVSGRCKVADDWPFEEDSWKYEKEPIRTFNSSANLYDIAMKFRTWRRPSFKCDCSTSSYLYQDPDSGLCKLNFTAVLAPCLEGGKGYEDCVVNKTAYCSVLHWGLASFFKELKGRRTSHQRPAGSATKARNNNNNNRQTARQTTDKPFISYTCVCSPEKTLLVDKPRGKAKCVRECDMVNNECVRYNRMCRPALMKPDNYLTNVSLVSTRSDNAGQFNIQDTGCECLPGFTGPLPDTDDDCKNTTDMDSSGISSDADSEQQNNKHMRINTSCLLDFDVIELYAKFKAPVDFDPTWLLNDAPGGYTREQIGDFWASRAESGIAPGGTGSSTQSNNNGGPTATATTSTTAPASKLARQNFKDLEADGSVTKQSLSVLEAPDFMWFDSVDELHRKMIIVGFCDYKPQLNREFYLNCVKHRYWIVQKLRKHFIDWRSVLVKHLKETFDLMDGNVKVRVNDCQSVIRESSSKKWSKSVLFGRDTWFEVRGDKPPVALDVSKFGVSQLDRPILDPTDETEILDSDLVCNLTVHSSPSPVINISPEGSPPVLLPYPARKVELGKQLVKFIFDEKTAQTYRDEYQLMVPEMLIKKETMNNLKDNWKSFNPCNSSFDYCDKQTTCARVSAVSVNFTCTCKHGFTPISSKDIYDSDSRKEVCEDINECLFDICKEKANVSRCVNEIGDYRCECMTPYVKDNNGNCKDACDLIPCHQEHGICRRHGDYPVCECKEGYTKLDCSTPDPNVALRKANMIIIGSIFSSVLLLAITVAISQSRQLKKKKLELEQIKAEQESFRMYEFARQRPTKHRASKRAH